MAKDDQPSIFQDNDIKIEKREPVKRVNPDRAMADIVGVFCDPIIVMPGGWGDSLPEWLKGAITMERLIGNVEALKTGAMTATDAEACAYLYTACLEAAPSHDWAQIYLYVAGKVYEGHRTKDSGVTMPEDIRVTELTRNQQDDLAHLKAWIYDRRIKHRKGQERAQRKEAEAGEEAVAAPANPQLIFDLWKKD